MNTPADTLCRTCRLVTRPEKRRECWACQVRRVCGEVFDDGHGAVDARMRPLYDALCAAANPRTSFDWLRSSAVRERLRSLVTGKVALSHDGIDTLPPGLGREYLRELLIAHEVLPARDKYLAAFDRWSQARLERIENEEHRQIIRVYIYWHHHRRLRERAELGRLQESATGGARQHTNVAVEFLTWLTSRGRYLEACTQADIDAWFATGTTTRWAARNFLAWAMDTRRCPRLVVPRYRGRAASALSQTERLTILNRLFHDTGLELADRVAGSLVLLYAQPIARVREFTIDDLRLRRGEVTICIAGNDLPLPEPVGGLALSLARQRPNMTSAANPSSRWLFPGRAPGQAIQAEQLAERLARLGISHLGRLAALNQLVAEIPAPVLAKLIGYSPNVIAQHAVAQRADWAYYAALKARELAD